MSAQSPVRSSDHENRSARMPVGDHDLGGVIELMGAPMSFARTAEIYGEGEPADYLGLTIETVSRTLTTMENASTIELSSSRRIVLRNRSALSRLNS